MKLFKNLSFAIAVMLLLASCELTQAPLEFGKNPEPPMESSKDGMETGPLPGDDKPPE